MAFPCEKTHLLCLIECSIDHLFHNIFIYALYIMNMTVSVLLCVYKFWKVLSTVCFRLGCFLLLGIFPHNIAVKCCVLLTTVYNHILIFLLVQFANLHYSTMQGESYFLGIFQKKKSNASFTAICDSNDPSLDHN